MPDINASSESGALRVSTWESFMVAVYVLSMLMRQETRGLIVIRLEVLPLVTDLRRCEGP